MANDEFIIPGGYNTETARHDVEVAFSQNVEKREQLHPYAEIKELERQLETARASADIDAVLHLGAFTRMGDAMRLNKTRSDEDRLVEKESWVGGKVIPLEKVQFFFLKGYWYLIVHDDRGSMVASYQFTDDEAYKIVNGRNVPFVQADYFDEKENVMTVIPLAVRAIMKDMYDKEDEARDEIIADAMKDVDQEYEDMALEEGTDPIDAELDALLKAKDIAKAIEEQKQSDHNLAA